MTAIEKAIQEGKEKIQTQLENTTNIIRDRLTISQKYRNAIALGLFGFASAFIVALIIIYYNTWYLRQSLEINAILSDTIFSYSTAAGSIGLLITVIVGGAFSDDYRSKYGARAPFILVGCLIAGFVMVLLPIVGNLFPEDLLIIVFPLCFFIIYSGLGLGSSPTNALLSELFTKEQRGWIGLILAGFTTLGSFGGIFINRFVADNFGIPLIFPFSGIILFLIGITIFALVEKVNPPFPPIDSTLLDIKKTPSYLISFGSGGFTKMLVVQSLWGFASASVSIYLIVALSTPEAVDFLGEGNEGIVLVVTGIVAAIMAIPAGFIIQKVGKVRTALVGSFIFALYCFGLAFIVTGYYSLLLILAAIGGLGSIFIESVRVSLPADLVPEGKEAQFMGINKFASIWTQPVVAILGAQIIILFANQNPTLIIFSLAGVASILATIILFFITYEKMIKTEYDNFYKRYLIAKGFAKEIIDKGIEEISQAFQ
jgi:MFS family permease